MCRINGLIDKNISSEELIKMRDTLIHGGPDDAGIFMDEQTGVGLAQRRLSIIDLTEGGHQPMLWDKYVIVFNGEIYNYKEVKASLVESGYTFNSNSDTEVIIKAFDCWSYDAVKRFRGMFAFALWDKVKKTLLLCRDRVGVKPLYWYLKDNVFMFASELKPFMLHPEFDKSIDAEAVSLYLQSGYIRSPYCIFKYAHKLEAGSFLEIDLSLQLKIWKYWDVRKVYEQTEFIDGSDSELIQDCENRLSESFQLRMVADVPVGVFLSGGIDSTLVTALLQKDMNTPLNTFTIGFENKLYNEAENAKVTAKHLGTHHTELICTTAHFEEIIDSLPEMYDEPFGDSSAIPTHLVSRMAREKVTVSLSADGGDELFTGYNRYLFAHKYYSKLQAVPSPVKNIARSLLDKLTISQIRSISSVIDSKGKLMLASRMPKLVEILGCKDIIDFLYRATTQITNKELLELVDCAPDIFNRDVKLFENHLFSAFGLMDIDSYLEGDILAKVDRATMSVALEGREPFLDHKVIEYAFSLPDRMKIRDGKTKWILRQILQKYVPIDHIERPKMGFAIPLDQWFSTILKDDLEQMLADDDFYICFGLDMKHTKSMISGYINGKYNKPYFIWYLYVLHKWFKKWM